MRCSSCGHDNREHSAFCETCGARLALACSGCGVQLRPSARFCDSCGQPLGVSGAPERAPTPDHPQLPTSFGAGRYEVRRLLGEGAKKRVYLVHDTRLDRDVAFALIKTEGLDETGRARIRREAQAMGRLGDHPHIVTVYDIGDEVGQPYIVSQYMAGGDVEELLQTAKHHRLPLERSVRIADQICLALEHAHARGVIHRDLKPGNVWLTHDGVAMLGDFGLAVALDRPRLTTPGMMVGTAVYMAPEQALGRPPGPRSDLYALGAMLYEMVTGRPPFLGDDAVSVISQHINTAPVAPSWHNPELPRSLEALILRLLAKTPDERPSSAAAVRQALAAISSTAVSVVEPVVPEEVNPLDRLAGGIFVGREREMDELRAGLEDTLSGHGRLLMLVGEPGIGKTRTAEELATYAGLRDAQVLWGRCYEGEGAPAYWPWVQVIRSYVYDRDPGALLSEMGSGAADIAQVVSQVRECLPGLPAPPPLEPAEARFRLFDSITTFLKNAARRHPLVLILDDLHTADKPSLLLLEFLAREQRHARLLVVGTYRDVELGRQHPLAQTLAELNREQLSRRILLRGLSERDVARFIEMTAGLTPPPALVTAVYAETEGNPFFVNEIVRLLVAEGRLERAEEITSWSVTIPQGVREVIGRRLDRLSDDCNRVLTIAAVIGREFGLDALERVSDFSGERLLERLEEALGARVIKEVPRAVGLYVFAHALIRETLYNELTTTRRVRLHRQIGEALEALYGNQPEPHLAELAYHFFEAAQGGDVQKAIDYAVRAGNRAAALMAHEEAARQYEVGLQALEQREPRDEPRCCELLLTLSETLWRAGEYERAKDTSLRAAALARKLGAAEQLARAALGFGGRLLAFAAVSRDETLVGLLEEALAALRERDSALRASVLSRLAEEITFSDPYERRDSLCQEAIAMARRGGDPTVLARVLRSTHWALWVPENLEKRLNLATEVVQLAERIGDRAMMLEGHLLCLWDLLEFGDVGGAQGELDVVTRLAEELRQAYYRWAVAITRGLLAFVQGRLTEVEPLAQQALQMGQEAQNQNPALVFGLQTALLLREQGRTQEMELLLISSADTYPLLLPNLRCALAALYGDAGRESEGRSEFERLAVHDFADLPRTMAWLFSICFLAEVSARLGDTQRANRLYDLLLPFAERNVTVSAVLSFGAASRYLGLLSVAVGDRQQAARHFEAALAMNARMGTRQALARTQAEYADMLLSRGEPGDRTRAVELVNQALDIARDLGMKPVVEKALALKLCAQGVATGGLLTSIDAVAVAVDAERPDLHPHAAPDGTVTILFTDIEGSTAMAERLGDQRWVELLRRHNALVRQDIRVHGGFEVKCQGDGFMVAFQSAVRALHCAIAIQQAVAADAAQHPVEPLRLRIGLHTGEVIKDADDFFGKNVILAARIATQACGGEILVSSLVKELAESAGSVRFEKGQEVELRGLAGTHTVHRVVWSGTSG